MIFEVICYSLSGFFMKISDESMDKKDNLILGVITGLLCVIFTLLVSTASSDAACIFLSIVIGTALASKLDSPNHILSALLFVGLLLILGFPSVPWYLLLICIIGVFIDEKGNDKSDEMEMSNSSSENALFYKFFKYRYSLKITVFLLSLLGLIKLFSGNLLSDYSFFSPLTIVYFFAFDLSYEGANLIFDRFYDFLQTFFRIG